MKLIIFDLDGTLANDSVRVAKHLVGEKPFSDEAWANYFAECSTDTPIYETVMFYQFVTRGIVGVQSQIWSGRSEAVREQTEFWIHQHLYYPPALLLMRGEADRTNDNELKRSWLYAARARGDEVMLVLEDRARVVDMWREEGVPCWQVAKGDF